MAVSLTSTRGQHDTSVPKVAGKAPGPRQKTWQGKLAKAWVEENRDQNLVSTRLLFSSLDISMPGWESSLAPGINKQGTGRR